jgi:hypothetical protein
MKAPTERQYDSLLTLGSGSAGLSWRKRETEQLLRRGWATAELTPPYYQWVRITAEGLRALAVAVERYGLPDLKPQEKTHRRVCAACGSTTYRYESITAAEIVEQAA